MLEWLKRKLGAGGPSRDDLKALANYLAPLDHVRRGLAQRALAYVVEGVGEPPTGVPGCAKALSLACVTNFTGLVPQRRFMDRQRLAEPLANLRMARLLHAAAVADGWSPPPSLPPEAGWLEVFLREISGFGANVYSMSPGRVQWDAATLSAMAAADGLPPGLLVQAAFDVKPDDVRGWTRSTLLTAFRGFGDVVSRDPGPALEVLRTGPAARRTRALELLRELRPDLAPFREVLVRLAVSSARTVRDPAASLLEGQPVRAELEALAREGRAEERAHAARLLARLFPQESRATLDEVRAGASSKLKETLDELLEPSAPTAPAPVEIPRAAALSEETRRVFRTAVASSHEAVARLRATGVVKGAPEAQLRFLESGAGDGVRATLHAATPLGDLLACPDLGLGHLARLLWMLGYPHERGGEWVLSYPFWHVVETYRRAHPDFSLRDLEAALSTFTHATDVLGQDQLLSTWTPELDWPREAVIPYYAERLHLVEEALELRPASSRRWIDRPTRRRRALKLLAGFGTLPPSLRPRLWDLALTGGKADLPLARAVLAQADDVRPRLVQELRNGKQEVRAGAADWLGRLGDGAMADPLLAAVRKERQEVAKVAMMGALERLGVPLDAFLDREGLAKEAAAGLKAGLPEALSWFPWNRLPDVRWEDDATAVGEPVLRWTLVKAFKARTPEPGPLLRRYAALWSPAGREELGRLVLDAWIARDTKPRHTHAEAIAGAERDLPQWIQWSPERSPESLRGWLVQMYLDATEGSAIAEKGLLAVVGACGSPGAIAALEAYLKKWYGRRSAQCKALLGALSGMEHPLAVQLLLSVANRFRTRGIQQEAHRLVEALAERHGWTVEQLADRTLPAAGLDESGELTLDYGARRFSVRLTPDMKLAVFDPDGKELSGLPEPRQADDADLAKEAARILKEARAELKALLKSQPLRLYEAMCLGRSWRFDEWDLYLHRHAILRAMVARVVWRTDDGVTFRPLDDGSLTDVQDEAVVLDAATPVRVAHRLDVDEGTAAAWTRHLADYGKEPLFDQFGKPPYRLPESAGDRTELTDFRGFLVPSARLRSRATALGYSRGPAEDGGWFYTYLRIFTGAPLEASLTFSGNSLPEENRTVALDHLSFAVPADAGGGSRPLRLKDVPPVLLSECWNDLSRIAAEGPGFDPEWETKVRS